MLFAQEQFDTTAKGLCKKHPEAMQAHALKLFALQKTVMQFRMTIPVLSGIQPKTTIDKWQVQLGCGYVLAPDITATFLLNSGRYFKYKNKVQFYCSVSNLHHQYCRHACLSKVRCCRVALTIIQHVLHGGELGATQKLCASDQLSRCVLPYRNNISWLHFST